MVVPITDVTPVRRDIDRYRLLKCVTTVAVRANCAQTVTVVVKQTQSIITAIHDDDATILEGGDTVKLSQTAAFELFPFGRFRSLQALLRCYLPQN